MRKEILFFCSIVIASLIWSGGMACDPTTQNESVSEQTTQENPKDASTRDSTPRDSSSQDTSPQTDKGNPQDTVSVPEPHKDKTPTPESPQENITSEQNKNEPALPDQPSTDQQPKENQPTEKLPEATVEKQPVIPTSCLQVFGSLNFGTIKTGCQSKTRTILLRSLCSAKTSILSIQLSGQTSKDFTITSKHTTPIELKSNEEVLIEVGFQASSAGTKTGDLVVQSSETKTDISIPIHGVGKADAKRTDTYKIPSPIKSDILFVIDNTCSMGDEQDKLSKVIPNFLTWAKNLNIQFHIGVTTTDTTGSKIASGKMVGITSYLTPASPNLEQEFAQRSKVGTSGSGQENGIQAAYDALTSPMITSDNKGFLRSDASLAIIFMSDEDDNKSPLPIKEYIQFFKNLKGPSKQHQVRISGITGPEKVGCRNAGRNAAAAPRYHELIKATGGIHQPICDANWNAFNQNLADALFGLPTSFPLKTTPDVNSISVKVDGKAVTKDPKKGWSYEQATNQIRFDVFGGNYPKAGATIEISYTATCQP